MRLLYIVIGDINSAKGVYNKIKTQIEELNKLDIDAEGLIFVDSTKKLEDIDKIKFITIKSRIEGKPISVYDFIDMNIADKEFDYIYLRYSHSTSDLLKFSEKYGAKIIFEHNAKEAEEFRSNIKELTTRDFLYAIRNPISNGFSINLKRVVLEKRYAPKVLSKVKLGVCITDEIALHQKNKFHNYPTVTIPNGIKVGDYVKRDLPTYDGKSLNLVLISGHENNWHGVDRLLQGMAIYKGTVKIRLKLIGLFQKEVKELVNSLSLNDQVDFLPLLNKLELDQELKNCHVGIGHLAFFRKNLSEGAVLKIREYLARGIPYIVSHKEVDVESNEKFRPYYLKIPHNNSPVDMSKVISFTEGVYAIPDFDVVLKELAMEYIDISVKMKSLIESIMQHTSLASD